MREKMRKLLKSNKGFTMIELMVVIVIMLILAAIAIPSFNRLITEANTTAATSEARTVLLLAQLEAESAVIDGAADDAAILAAVEAASAEILEDAGLDSGASVTYTVTGGTVTVEYTSNGVTVKLPE